MTSLFLKIFTMNIHTVLLLISTKSGSNFATMIEVSAEHAL